jgi:hypothetical protein
LSKEFSVQQSDVIRQSVILTAAMRGLVTSIGAPASAQTGAPSDTAFQSAGSDDTEQQRYRFVVNHNSGKCLDVRGVSTMDGAAVVQTTCDRTHRSHAPPNPPVPPALACPRMEEKPS